jgi:hypothetical protein
MTTADKLSESLLDEIDNNARIKLVNPTVK